MSFFPPEPEPSEPGPQPEREPEPPWRNPPRDEVAAVLPVSALLGATEHAALVLRTVRVHRAGIVLDVDSKARRGGASEEEWDDLQDRVGFGFGRRRGRSRGQHSRSPRLGVELEGGRRVLAFDDGPGDETAPRLTQGGGSGSAGDDYFEHRWEYWLWPLPAAGDVVVVADWPGFGMQEHRETLPGDAMRAAAARIEPIWPGAGPTGAGAQPHWTIGF